MSATHRWEASDEENLEPRAAAVSEDRGEHRHRHGVRAAPAAGADVSHRTAGVGVPGALQLPARRDAEAVRFRRSRVDRAHAGRRATVRRHPMDAQLGAAGRVERRGAGALAAEDDRRAICRAEQSRERGLGLDAELRRTADRPDRVLDLLRRGRGVRVGQCDAADRDRAGRVRGEAPESNRRAHSLQVQPQHHPGLQPRHGSPGRRLLPRRPGRRQRREADPAAAGERPDLAHQVDRVRPADARLAAASALRGRLHHRRRSASRHRTGDTFKVRGADQRGARRVLERRHARERGELPQPRRKPGDPQRQHDVLARALRHRHVDALREARHEFHREQSGHQREGRVVDRRRRHAQGRAAPRRRDAQLRVPQGRPDHAVLRFPGEPRARAAAQRRLPPAEPRALGAEGRRVPSRPAAADHRPRRRARGGRREPVAREPDRLRGERRADPHRRERPRLPSPAPTRRLGTSRSSA